VTGSWTERSNAQNEILALLEALPRTAYDRNEILSMVENSRIPRAALFLHKHGIASRHGVNTSQQVHHFVRAIECFLLDEDKEFRQKVFEFVKTECTDLIVCGEFVLRDAVYTKLSDLVLLDPIMTATLVAELFIEDLDRVIASLEVDNCSAQFQFLHAIISEELSKNDSVAAAVMSSNLSTDHHHIYLALMARLHPDMVYGYLSTHDNYRTEECLKLCQEYDISDASAYLLERRGSISSALQLVLQTLEARMMTLKRFVRGLHVHSSDHRRVGFFSTFSKRLQKENEFSDVKRMLTVALDLCDRNSSPKSEHGSQLWFNVLDRLINAKGFLRLAKELPEHARIMHDVLRELLQQTMQRMVSNVPLPDLVRKITTDHSRNRLGEFRDMIAGMLKTYGYELRVTASAVEAMHQDVRYMARCQRQLKSAGSRIRRITLKKGGFSFDTVLRMSPSEGDANIHQSRFTGYLHNREIRGEQTSARLRKRNYNNTQSERSAFKFADTGGPGPTPMCYSPPISLVPRRRGVMAPAEHFGRFL